MNNKQMPKFNFSTPSVEGGLQLFKTNPAAPQTPRAVTVFAWQSISNGT